MSILFPSRQIPKLGASMEPINMEQANTQHPQILIKVRIIGPYDIVEHMYVNV